MMSVTHPALHLAQATLTKDDNTRENTLYNKVAYLNQSVVWAFVYIESWLIFKSDTEQSNKRWIGSSLSISCNLSLFF